MDALEGQRIVVYGASGAMGTAAVQLAKHFGAHVTAVCNTKNVELVRSLGADVVVDYLQEDFRKKGETYDVVLDAVGKYSFRRCRRALKPHGVYVATDLGFMWHVPLLALWSRGSGERKLLFPLGSTDRRTTSSSSRSSSRRGSTGRSSTAATRWRSRRGAQVRRDGPEDRQRRSDLNGAGPP